MSRMRLAVGLTSVAGVGWKAAPNVGRALAVMQQGLFTLTLFQVRSLTAKH